MYLDAIWWRQAADKPSTGTVRSLRTKDGLGLNLKHQLAPDFGLLPVPASCKVNSRTFTVIDQSISGGLSPAG